MKIIIILTFAALTVVAENKDPEELTKNRAIYLEKLAEIKARHDADAQKVTARYANVLEGVQKALSKKGDLDGALAARNELKLLKGNDPAASIKKNKAPAVLLEKRKVYLKKLDAVKSTRDKSIRLLSKRYVGILKKIQDNLTKKGDLDSALLVKKEIEGIRVLAVEPKTGPVVDDDLAKLEIKSFRARRGEKRHYYTVVKQALDWQDAKKRCEELGGYLACVETKEEHEFIGELLKGHSNIWLGATNESGEWRWVNGSPVAMDWGWSIGVKKRQPDNYGGGVQYMLTMYRRWDGKGGQRPNKWYDTIDLSKTKNVSGGFVCEWEEPPK